MLRERFLPTVAKDSLDAGFEGFVVFDSKTVLIDHYVEKYGARVLFGNRLYFDTKASKALINKYLKGKKMVKNLILVNTNSDILKYDNRKAIELAQTLGRPLTINEYESLKIKKTAKRKKPILSKMV
jgi:hypothetical protein